MVIERERVRGREGNNNYYLNWSTIIVKLTLNPWPLNGSRELI